MYQSKDYDITNKWEKIDEINIYLSVNKLVYILSQITLLDSYDDFHVKITDNGQILYDNYYAYIDHLDLYPLSEGPHKLELYMKSVHTKIKLRPSKGSGFQHSYQFATWLVEVDDKNEGANSNTVITPLYNLRDIFVL
jgi:hypothetical protein